LALFLFGGQVLNGFSFALVCGIVVGTYSSVFVASPILIFWHNFLEGRKRPFAGPPSASRESAGGPKPPTAPKAPKENARRGTAKVK
jgi:preprotein translocase subunit SecF